MKARSVLFLPASNPRAIEKARTLDCDIAVLDLEDAVAPEAKDAARRAALEARSAGVFGPTLAVRVNGLDTPWGADDLAAVGGFEVVVAPKVESGDEARALRARLPESAGLWAMVETPAGILRLDAIAGAGVAALVLGVNDLAAGLRSGPSCEREPLKTWLAATVAAARAHGLLAIDGVFNRFEDDAGFEAECAQGRLYGFDGKSLIHPRQIAAANAAFAPTAAEIEQARAIVEAFAAPQAVGKGAIRVGGQMVERLHLEQAKRVLDL